MSLLLWAAAIPLATLCWSPLRFSQTSAVSLAYAPDHHRGRQRRGSSGSHCDWPVARSDVRALPADRSEKPVRAEELDRRRRERETEEGAPRSGQQRGCQKTELRSHQQDLLFLPRFCRGVNYQRAGGEERWASRQTGRNVDHM
ncbi:unnamed protein product [Pleuronectes platessa]|uniref:Secreted protein n=1 Tax=Pleuronectes platessa TaxID=8262 RepID=A0A9N7VSF4_PLEPL|nr:unnamed protein product [Pleuronectes platessa]